jgi:hypothetical protein
MTIHGSKLENACKLLLQKEITMDIGKKSFKKGKLILFYQKNFFLVFIMKTSKKDKEKIEIPIPYDVEVHEDDNLVFFDYRIKTLAKYSPDIEMYLSLYPKKIAGNKFWDTILLIDGNQY